MKKTITSIIIVASVIAAQAASFNWGLVGDRVQLPTGTYVTDGSATGYLVYLGNTATETYTIDAYAVSDPSVDSGVSTSTGFSSTLGSLFESYQQDAGTEIAGTGENFANDAVFGMYIVKDGWINIAANTYTVSGLVDDTSTLSDAVFTFDWTQNAEGDPATSGGGWAAVPEPATAALALAGLAMLIRRRK